jgi:hypothetical protein
MLKSKTRANPNTKKPSVLLKDTAMAAIRISAELNCGETTPFRYLIEI